MKRLSIDEAIVSERNQHEFSDYNNYHKQLAELLQELKAYRDIGTVEECKNSILDIEKAYNKAIDDLREKLMQHGFIFTQHALDIFDEIAEQLKEVNKNGYVYKK